MKSGPKNHDVSDLTKINITNLLNESTQGALRLSKLEY